MLNLALFLCAQVREVHLQLDTYLARWAGSIEASSTTRGSQVLRLYLHGATVEDVAINTLLRRQPPLFSTVWSGAGQALDAPGELEPIRLYAQQVNAATDDYLTGLTIEAVSRRVDLSRLNLGHQTVAWVVSRFVVLELAHLGGELLSAAHISGADDHPCATMYRIHGAPAIIRAEADD